MPKPSEKASYRRQRYLPVIFIALAIVVFIITLVGIRESRTDSLQLLVRQGTSLTEALAQAAENAIVSESFFDYLVHKRYSELVIDVASYGLEPSERQLSRLALDHGIYSIHVFGLDSTIRVSGVARPAGASLPDYVVEEAALLLANPETNYVLLLDVGDIPGEAMHYYLEITNDLQRVVIIVADALYYTDALKKTQIGYLAQNMSREKGVEYVIYQSKQGIVFSSRTTGELLAIDSDPFLTEALRSDTISNRIYDFQDKTVLELVRPFSTEDYPFGLLRVGLSLERYYSVSRGFNIQMVTLSGVLFVLVVVVLLYLSGREKRQEIARKFVRIKSVTDKIFDEMRTGVAVVDKQGTITQANKAFGNILGASDVVGKPWLSVIPANDPVLMGILTPEGRSVENETTNEFNYVRKTLLVSSSSVELEGDETGGIVVVVYDITRLKEFEAKSVRKERLSELGNLAAAVAHEIRNPLNTISIAVQRLASEFTPKENAEEYHSFTGQIRSETKRLNDIITRFLALARDEKQRLTKVNLKELVDETCQLLKPEADKLGIELKGYRDPKAVITADPAGLKQILSNLFNNAKEALAGKPGQVVIDVTCEEDIVTLAFFDDGPGIPKNVRDKIFTPYYTTKKSGTGLGLSTVHKIVTDAGGEIRMETSHWGGARFVMEFPREK